MLKQTCCQNHLKGTVLVCSFIDIFIETYNRVTHQCFFDDLSWFAWVFISESNVSNSRCLVQLLFYGNEMTKLASLGKQEASLLHIVNNDCYEMLVQCLVECRAKSWKWFEFKTVLWLKRMIIYLIITETKISNLIGSQQSWFQY